MNKLLAGVRLLLIDNILSATLGIYLIVTVQGFTCHSNKKFAWNRALADWSLSLSLSLSPFLSPPYIPSILHARLINEQGNS